MKISGNVEDIIFRNADNGYTVFSLDMRGVLVTCVGKCTSINCGEDVELIGDYTKNSKFGQQFAFVKITTSTPKSCESIKKYLASGLIRGIGPVIAENIVEKFKEETLNIIELAPIRLAEVRNVSQRKAMEIGQTFSEIKRMQNAVMFLQNFNITTNLSVKIFNFYQEKTIDVVSTNPYKLVEDIDGVGFLTADKIAQNMGVDVYSSFRVRASILHTLKEAADKSGNTYLCLDELETASCALLTLEQEKFSSVFDSAKETLVLDGVIKIFESKDRQIVMLKNYYYAESNIAKRLNMLSLCSQQEQANLDDEISEFERVNKINFHEDQKTAIKMAINNSVSVITGGPGTGKTTIIKCVLQILKNQTNKIYLLAPTGRASKRLSEACKHNASTIHRALEINFKSENSAYFVFNDKNKLPADVVVVDEVSMLDVTLANHLLSALPNTCKLVLVGDKDQLPSVGPGNLLHDILQSNIIPSCYLTHIYRQDERSLIVSNAHLINDGKMPDLTNKGTDFFFESKQTAEEILSTVVELVTYRLPKFCKTEPKSIQVLSPMRSGTCGVERLNKDLQEIINPSSLSKTELRFEVNVFREGDKVMQIVNNYNLEWKKSTAYGEEYGKGVFNGDMGYIKSIDRQTGETLVEFDDERQCVYSRVDVYELQICYATTVHKSQGSEFDVVVMPLLAGSPQIITRNLLYTAVTRAKKLVVLVGSKKNLARMIYNNFISQRNSMLCDFLIQNKKKVDFLYGES